MAVDKDEEADQANRTLKVQPREVSDTGSNILTIEGAQVLLRNDPIFNITRECDIHEVLEHEEELLLVVLDLILIDKDDPELSQLVL